MDKGTRVFRDFVWKIMDERKISKNKFALEAEVTPQSVTRWTSGQASPTLREVVRIAEAFDCHVEIVPN